MKSYFLVKIGLSLCLVLVNNCHMDSWKSVLHEPQLPKWWLWTLCITTQNRWFSVINYGISKIPYTWSSIWGLAARSCHAVHTMYIHITITIVQWTDRVQGIYNGLRDKYQNGVAEMLLNYLKFSSQHEWVHEGLSCTSLKLK
jgi:hypothetical protein